MGKKGICVLKWVFLEWFLCRFGVDFVVILIIVCQISLLFVTFMILFVSHCVTLMILLCHILSLFLHFMPLFSTFLTPFSLSAALALLRNEQGFSALHICSLHNHVDIARALLSRGADPSAQTRYGATALHLACQYGSEPVVIALIESKVHLIYWE